MTADRVCVRGCTVSGEHYAACVDYGRGTSGECSGCVGRQARDGVLLCDRCYGRLRGRLEVVPDLVAHLRSLTDPLGAVRYDRVRVQSSGDGGSLAPVSSELLDACRDIIHVIGAPPLRPGADAAAAYTVAEDAVEYILLRFDSIANDSAAVLEWWRLVMSDTVDGLDGFWTVTAALRRWQMEDRRRRAQQPCPECGLLDVTITPPRRRLAHTWFECGRCGWRRTDVDEDGIWAAAFGQYAESRPEERSIMAETKIEAASIDLSGAITDGIGYVLDHQEAVERIGPFGVPTAAIVGAMPSVAEQFALIADQIAEAVRRDYKNGDLLAGGARLVASAIRASVTAADTLGALASLAQPAAGDDDSLEQAA